MHIVKKRDTDNQVIIESSYTHNLCTNNYLYTSNSSYIVCKCPKFREKEDHVYKCLRHTHLMRAFINNYPHTFYLSTFSNKSVYIFVKV